MKYLFLLLITIQSAIASERYVLPESIKIELSKVLESKRKLDYSIVNTYKKLCWKENLNEAEYIEILAYREITGLDCYNVILLRL